MPIYSLGIPIRDEVSSSHGFYPSLGEGGGGALSGIISSLFTVGVLVATIFTFFYLLWAGYNWLTAGGDKAKVDSARQRLTNGIIGLAIVASALAISTIVNQFFGISITTNGN